MVWSRFKTKGRNGAALNDLRQGPLVLLQFAGVLAPVGFGLFLVRIVPQGFDGADHLPSAGLDRRGGKPAPFAVVAQLWEKNLRFVGTVDQLGFFPLAAVQVPDLLIAFLVQNDIGHGGPFAVPEGNPLAVVPTIWDAG
jgi:hypothetical protein